MDRRLALLVALLLPGCSGSTDTAQPEPEQTPARVAQAEKEKPVREKPADPLDNFDPSKFSLGDGSNEPAEIAKEEMPKEEMPAESKAPAEENPPQPMEKEATPKSSLPPLVIAGAPTPPAPFSGQEQDPGTLIPEDVQRQLNDYEIRDFDAMVKLVLTYPQAEVRKRACEKFYSNKELRPEDGLLTMRAALGDPDPQVRTEAVHTIRFAHETGGWKSQDALGELVRLLHDEQAARAVILTIAELGPDGAPAVPYLAEAMSDPEYPNRTDIFNALGKIGPAAASTAPQLAKIVEEEQITQASWALGSLGAEDALLTLMGNESEEVRNAAYEGVVRLPTPQRPETAKAVLKGTESEDHWGFERSRAAEALGKIRPTTPEIVDALIRLAGDKQQNVRSSAYESMGTLDPPSDKVIPVLIEALEKEKGSTKYAIQQALSACKGSPEVRLQALLQLAMRQDENLTGAISEGAKDFYPLMRKLVEDETKPLDERALALFYMEDVRSSLDRDKEEVDDEIRELALRYSGPDQPGELRCAAGLALRACGESANNTNELLLAGITSEGLSRIRRTAASELCRREYEPALPALIACLKSDDPKLALNALGGIGKFGARAKDAVPIIVALAPIVSDGDDVIFSMWQFDSLGKIGAHPEISMPFLEEKWKTEKNDTRRRNILTAQCLIIAANDLDASKVLPEVEKQMESTTGYAERVPFEMLQALGPKAAPLTPKMIELLASEDAAKRDGAMDVLEKIGPAAKDAAPALVAAAASRDNPWRPLNTLAAIQAGGPELAAIVPQLMQKLENRPRLLQTLAAIGPAAGAAAPAVIEVLDSPDRWERRNAVEALGAMQAASKPALPKLKDLALNDTDSGVREVAAQALLKIAPDDPEVAEVVFSQLEIRDEDAVAELLKNLGDAAPTFLIARTKSKEPSVRKNGLLLLSRTSVPREEALAIYKERLTDEDRMVKAAAAAGLLKSGERTPEVAAALVSSLSGEGDDWEIQNQLYHCRRQARPALVAVVLDQEKSAQLRRSAADLIRNSFDPTSDPDLKPLYAALAGDVPEQQMWAALTLAGVADHSAAVLKPLIAATKAEGPLQRGAIRGLSGFRHSENDQRDEVEAALADLLTSEDEQVARDAVNSLQYYKLADATVAKLLAMLKDEKTRVNAAEVLSTTSSPFALDDAAQQGVIAMLADEDEEIVDTAIRTLAASGPAGVEKIVDIAASKDSELSAATRGTILTAIVGRIHDLDQKLKLDDAAVAKLKQLTTEEPQRVATAAAIVLAEVDAKDVQLGPALLHGFDWDDYSMRNYARVGLQKRVSEADVLIPELTKRLSTETNAERRDLYAQALAGLGKDSPEANAAVIDVLIQYDPDHRQQQLGSELSDEGKKLLAGMLAKIDDPQRKSRALWAYFQAIRYRGNQEKQEVPEGLLEAVKSDDPEINLPAALAMAQLDPEAADAVGPLMTELEGEDPRWEVYEALRRLKKVAAPAVPRLIVLLERPDSRGAGSIIQLLGDIGPDASAATDVLTKRISDENQRYNVIDALKKIGPAAKAAAPAIGEQIHGTENLSALASALIAIDGPTDELIAEYERRLNDRYLRYDAMESLDSIAAIKPIAPYLAKGLNSDDAELQVAAAHVISELEKPDSSNLAPLLAHIDAKSPKVSAAMIAAAAKQPDSAEKVLPILEQKLKSPETVVRMAAATGIGNYHEQGKSLVPALVPLLADEELVSSVISTLGEIGPGAAPAVPQLQQLLVDLSQYDEEYDWKPRQRHWSAISALGKIGPASKPALPKLLELYGKADEKWDKRRLGEAIWKIDAEAAKQAGIEPPEKEEDEVE